MQLDLIYFLIPFDFSAAIGLGLPSDFSKLRQYIDKHETEIFFVPHA